MTGKEIRRLDDEYIVKQLTEHGLDVEDIAKLMKLTESEVRSMQESNNLKN